MFRTRILPVGLCVLFLSCTLPARADEDRDARIARRLREALDRDLTDLRSELRSLVEKELARPGTTPAGAAITAAELRAHVAVLASDAFAGRGSTQKGIWKAAAYIERELRRYGLKGMGDNGGFLQRFEVERGIEAANVLGLLEGTDPDLRDEVVVVGAHYDHLGTGHGAGDGRMDQMLGDQTGGDYIYNGADDNASGDAAVLETAQALAAAPPRRSVLFVFFAGEEMGLLGSHYYVRHPAIPLKRTAAMINLDMVGRNPTKPIQVVAADSSPEIKRIFTEQARALRTSIRFTPQTPMGGSDHESFYPKNIPVAHLFTGLHADYHRASDEVEKISPEQMERVARLVAAATRAIADLPARPRFRRVPSMELSRLLEWLQGMRER